MTALEKCGTPYVARLMNNAVLDRLAPPYLTRPVGRPPIEPRTWMVEMTYQAKDRSRERRVVLVIWEKPDEFLLHYFWAADELDRRGEGRGGAARNLSPGVRPV